MTRLNDEQLNALFNEPRTVNAFTEQPVTDEQLQKIYELAAMGPTAFNSQPLRITWVKTPEARERLVKHMMDGNKEKTLNAPVTAVLAFDKNWQKRFGEFAPQAAAFESYYEAEEARIPAGALSSALQAGYFITAVRALGLDAGPMTGADFDGIAAEFFEGTDQQPFLVVNLGYGVDPEYPRGTRFACDDETRSL